MNPDKEDPNNHAPAVSPDDDWDGLDVNQVFNSQLPPRRSDTPKVPRADVSITAYKSIDSERSIGSTVLISDGTHVKSSLSINVNVERSERSVSERDNFQAAHIMEEVKLSDDAVQKYQVTGNQGRFTIGERDDWGANQQAVSFRWMLYTAVGIILLISLTILLTNFFDEEVVSKNDKSNSIKSAPIRVEEKPTEELGELSQLANGNKDAMQIFQNYIHSTSVDDFSKSIYFSARNTPLAKDVWKPANARSGWVPSDASLWKTYQSGSTFYAELKGVNHDFSKFIAYFRYENSELKMDWKATTGYGTANFSDMKIAQGNGSEIRGWISPSDFFTTQLPESRYHSFLIASPDKEASIWAYTEKGSEVDKVILALFATSPITGESQSEAKVILNLERGDKETLQVQWIIKRLIAENWLDQTTL